MTNNFDSVLRERFAAHADPPPGPDFGDVRARAYASARRMYWRRPRPRVLVAALVAAIVISGGATALAFHYLGPSPGFTAGFSAFDRLPPAVPESTPPMALDHMAAHLGLTNGQAAQRWRLLQTGLTLGLGRSQREGKLYGLIGNDGTACLMLIGQAGSCINAAAAAHSPPGVLFDVIPGYSGQTPAIAALVADNIESVALSVNGQGRDVPIVNNSIYTDLTGVQPCDTLALDVTYGDGSSRSLALHNSLGETLTSGAQMKKDTMPACETMQTHSATVPRIDRGPKPSWPIGIDGRTVLGQQLVLEQGDLPAGFNGRDARSLDALEAAAVGPRASVAQQLHWGRLTGYSITFDKKASQRSYLAGVVSSVSVYRSTEGAREAITESRNCTESGLYAVSLPALPGRQGFACQLRAPRTYLVAWRQAFVVCSLRVSSVSGELDGNDVVALALRQAAHVAEAIRS